MNMEFSPEQQVELVAENLMRGKSVELVGLPGSGRSTLIQRVVQKLQEDDINTVVLRGVSTPTPFPLGSFISAQIPLGSGSTPPSMVSLARDLSDTLAARSSVIIIDDADLLDEASTRVLLVARQASNVPVLVSVRPRVGDLRETLIAHVPQRVQFTMSSMNLYRTHRMLQKELGVTLDPRSLALVTGIAGGLAGGVLAVTRAALASHRTRQSGDQTHISGFEWDRALEPLAEEYLLPCEEEDIQVLHGLATREWLPLDVAHSAPAWPRLHKLREQGLVDAIELGGEAQLVIFPPLLARYFEYERADLSPEQLQSMFGDRHRGFAKTFDPAKGLSVALLSDRVRNYWDRRYSESKIAWEESHDAHSALAYCIAKGRVSSAPASTADVYRLTNLNEPGWDRVAFRCWYAIHLMVIQGKRTEAFELLETVEQEDPDYEGASEAVRCHIALFLQTMATPQPPRAPHADDPQLVTDLLQLIRAQIYNAKGLAREAEHAILGMSRLSLEESSPEDIIVGVSLLLNEKTEQAATFSLSKYEEVSSNPLASWASCHAYTAGLALGLSGQMKAFDSHIQKVQSLLNTNLNIQYLDALFTYATTVYALRGMPDKALGMAGYSANFNLGPEVSWGYPHRAVEEIAAGNWDHGAAIAWTAVERYYERGLIVNAFLLGFNVLFFGGNVDYAHRMSRWELTEDQAPLLHTLRRTAAALAEGDADVLLEMSSYLLDRGLRMPAILAGVNAALSFVKQGELVSAHRAAGIVWDKMKPAEHGCSGMFGPLVEAFSLTEREKEITVLIGSGRSTSHIAELLSLSPRTVEQHLLRASHKLGVSRRSELAKIARSWMAPFLT